MTPYLIHIVYLQVILSIWNMMAEHFLSLYILHYINILNALKMWSKHNLNIRRDPFRDIVFLSRYVSSGTALSNQ